MANLPETNTYTGGIYQLERTDAVDAGIGGNGVANLQALQLANRTKWLKNQIEALQDGTTLDGLADSGVTVLGGSGSQGNFTLNSGTQTFTESEYFFNNFTIGAGATVIIAQGARIHCAGTATIAGTLSVSTIPNSGGTGVGFLAAYGQIIYGSVGSGFGGGKIATGGNAYPYAAFMCGSSGASGSTAVAPGDNGSTGKGGDAGGFVLIEAAQIAITGLVEAKGGNAFAGTSVAGSPNTSGSGGGSGGVVVLKGLSSIVVSGTIDVRGGNASNAIGATAPGGGGGGGGIIAIISPSNNTTGSTILLSGGSAGTGAGVASYGGGGGGCGGAGGNQEVAGGTGLLLLRTFLAN